MKGLSGVELLHHLITEGRHTPVIFITAFPDERIRNHLLEAGAVGFLRKPFSDEKLTRCLDTALTIYPFLIFDRRCYLEPIRTRRVLSQTTPTHGDCRSFRWCSQYRCTLERAPSSR